MGHVSTYLGDATPLLLLLRATPLLLRATLAVGDSVRLLLAERGVVEVVREAAPAVAAAPTAAPPAARFVSVRRGGSGVAAAGGGVARRAGMVAARGTPPGLPARLPTAGFAALGAAATPGGALLEAGAAPGLGAAGLSKLGGGRWKDVGGGAWGFSPAAPAGWEGHRS